MAVDFTNWKISDIDLNSGVMIVTFHNGEKWKFVDVKDWQYNRIMTAKDPIKELAHWAEYIPNHSCK